MKESFKIVDCYGSTMYFKDENLTIRHREDGPAIVYTDGGKEWYVDGLHHRIDGPAVDWVIKHGVEGNYKEYWLDGIMYTKEEFDEEIKKIKSVEDRLKAIEDKMVLINKLLTSLTDGTS